MRTPLDSPSRTANAAGRTLAPTGGFTADQPALSPRLQQIRAGGRSAMARFILDRERPMLARASSVLGSTCRRTTDPEDAVMETLGRLDERVRRRAVHARTEAQLGALVWTTLNSTLVDAIRKALRQQRCETAAFREDPRPRVALTHQLPASVEDPVWAVSRAIPKDRDQVLFFLVTRGLPVGQIAPVIGCSPAAARVRWGRLRRRIGDELESRADFSQSGVALRRCASSRTPES